MPDRFDPINEARPKAKPAKIFYDGECGLCHLTVRFILRVDTDGEAFRFAPLDSEVFRKAVPEEDRAALPDSVIVLTSEGRLLFRSAAVLYILRRLGGIWRLGARIGGWIPSVWLDGIYDAIARIRRHLFRRPKTACPLIPPHLSGRFE
ncbi:MAG TPA: DUF393 domain-containing protein [Blastocatellia bacterium]|nr:DUF393 domain-containing protein [Blastocatellia bacterium]